MGVAQYKQLRFKEAAASYNNAKDINPNDAQLLYNLALSYFQMEMYTEAVDNLKSCIKMDNLHPYAHNNLAFLYNMHQMYGETISTCRQAKEYNKHGHATHRHWAFAEYKEGNLVKALRKIRKGTIKNLDCAENWVVWGLILRSAGKL